MSTTPRDPVLDSLTGLPRGTHVCRFCQRRQVLHELLSSAVKFSRVKENPVVEVGALRRCDTPIYYARDNGIGFRMENAGTIFGLFQRRLPFHVTRQRLT